MTGIACGTVAFILYYGDYLDSTEVFLYAKALGIISAIFVFFQWAPQIWVTWRNQVPELIPHLGSF